MNQNVSRQLLFAASLIVVALLWGFIYALPRYKSTAAAETRATGLRAERKGITRAMQDFSRSKSSKTAPSPNTAAWMSTSILKKLEKNVESNNPYKNSQGVQLKLRSVTAGQITDMLDSMRSVNVVIKSFKLDDSDGNGRWNLELMVEVPS
ncbi:MAG: hypothetical protein ACI38Q_07985 [Candidatus Bruticola sp.]